MRDPGLWPGIKDGVTATDVGADGVSFANAVANGDAVAVAHATTPFVTAHPWLASPGFGFGPRFANPAILPAGDGRGLAFGQV